MAESVDPILHKRHDVFNVLVIPIIIYFLLRFFFDYYADRSTPFYPVCMVGEIYFFVDAAWLIIFPRSVASPRIIIAHHAVAALGWYTPMWKPPLAVYASACLLVEINTFFLIGRRVIDNEVLKSVFKVCFHISWIALRVVMYPMVLYFFTIETINDVKTVGTVLSVYSLGLILLIALTILNMKWTYDIYGRKLYADADKKGL
jgi:hypothetical protein